MVTIKLIILALSFCGQFSHAIRGHGSSSDQANSDGHSSSPRTSDISMWIDESQVREFIDTKMRIYAISDGSVLPYLLDPNFQSYLPTIPAEINSVNFTWMSGDLKQYFYRFDELLSNNTLILAHPLISISRFGPIPAEPSIFRVHLVCVRSISGIASLIIKLSIHNYEGFPLSGTPITLRLKKQCYQQLPSTECDAKCQNGGRCNAGKTCECRKGYVGKFCESALCFPQCMNGGVCISPGVCRCINGFMGPHCEGGICVEKCLNGGKCIQKDTCLCRRGYYGPRCEYSKCLIPCLNGGRCVEVDKCRCRIGFSGPQCEIASERSRENPNNSNGSRKKQKKKFV